ncbi:MAG: hypothetical protein CM1200mP1_10690 [Candidatus Neomarinimicrobiota bacterium]|nr:MAG: hypothetical protein CM1200mP1_10690 [Candidatus Neomarinimicrobiota bacterium]
MVSKKPFQNTSSRGYETSMIGKWHLKSQPTGFDNWKSKKGKVNITIL